MSPADNTPASPPPDRRRAPDRNWLERRDNRNRSHEGRRLSRREQEREALLRDWFGPDLARGAILEHQRDAESAAEILARVLPRLDRGPGLLLSDLRAAWEKLVGADAAQRSQPAAIQGSRLEIEVRDSTWLYMLEQFHKRQIVERVRAHTAGAVTEVRFVAVGRRRPERREPPAPSGSTGG
jgi:hypothetical protein